MQCPVVPTKVPTKEREILFNCAALGRDKFCCCIGYFINHTQEYIETVSLESRNVLSKEGYLPIDVSYKKEDEKTMKNIYYQYKK